MRFSLIEGPARTETCAGCNRSLCTGTLPYMPANGCGKPSKPEKAYKEERTHGCYCETCAAGLAEAEDAAHSVTQFYTDTAGGR